MHILLTAVLMLATTSAWADWVQFATSDDTVYYLDPASIRKRGNLRRVWELHDLKKRDSLGNLSYRALDEYDCDGERYRTLSLSMHSGPMASGQLLRNNDETSAWQHIPPNTIVEEALRLVCGQ